ncbi:MAG: hypothetical protein WC429_17460, partial [Verrucomicrobiia bacterium]
VDGGTDGAVHRVGGRFVGHGVVDGVGDLLGGGTCLYLLVEAVELAPKFVGAKFGVVGWKLGVVGHGGSFQFSAIRYQPERSRFQPQLSTIRFWLTADS